MLQMMLQLHRTTYLQELLLAHRSARRTTTPYTSTLPPRTTTASTAQASPPPRARICPLLARRNGLKLKVQEVVRIARAVVLLSSLPVRATGGNRLCGAFSPVLDMPCLTAVAGTACTPAFITISDSGYPSSGRGPFARPSLTSTASAAASMGIIACATAAARCGSLRAAAPFLGCRRSALVLRARSLRFPPRRLYKGDKHMA